MFLFPVFVFPASVMAARSPGGEELSAVPAESPGVVEGAGVFISLPFRLQRRRPGLMTSPFLEGCVVLASLPILLSDTFAIWFVFAYVRCFLLPRLYAMSGLTPPVLDMAQLFRAFPAVASFPRSKP